MFDPDAAAALLEAPDHDLTDAEKEARLTASRDLSAWITERLDLFRAELARLDTAGS